MTQQRFLSLIALAKQQFLGLIVLDDPPPVADL